MPEAYTHIRTARRTLAQSGAPAPDTAAYEMGANGPDPLFAYHVLQSAKKRPYDLAALGGACTKSRRAAFCGPWCSAHGARPSAAIRWGF